MATNIDTLTTYEAFAAAGVEDKAARAISKAIADSASVQRSDLATKGDLDVMKSDIRREIAEAKTDMAKTFWTAVIVIVALSGGINAVSSFLIARNAPAVTQGR